MKPVFPLRRLSFYEIEALFLSHHSATFTDKIKSNDQSTGEKIYHFFFIPPTTDELNLNLQGAAWVYLLLGAAGQPGDACYQVV